MNIQLIDDAEWKVHTYAGFGAGPDISIDPHSVVSVRVYNPDMPVAMPVGQNGLIAGQDCLDMSAEQLWEAVRTYWESKVTKEK